MMKAKWVVLCMMAGALSLAATARADLEKIGTANYNGSTCNLIWQHDASGTSLVWLDYSAPQAYWANQMSWAAALDGQLTYSIDSAYNLTWADTAWRLPTAGDDPGYGFQAATQELGHLYYDELGLTGGSGNSGVTAPDLAGTIFDNLQLTGYWTSTPGEPIFNTNPVWYFAMQDTRSTPYSDTVYGFQDVDATAGSFFGISLAVKHAGLAVRGAEISAVPAPAAVTLGLMGLAGLLPLIRRQRAA